MFLESLIPFSLLIKKVIPLMNLKKIPEFCLYFPENLGTFK